MRVFPLLSIICVFFIFSGFGLADAAITASKNFCEVFLKYQLMTISGFVHMLICQQCVKIFLILKNKYRH